MAAFLRSDAASGLVLITAAVSALILANSAVATGYFRLLRWPLGRLDLQHWINDGLMALFFLAVGLEMKRALLFGQLSDWPRRRLPGIAAAGGVIVPALVYAAVNIFLIGSGGEAGRTGTMRGWAIPSATDIAFALGVVSLFGSRVPMSLKSFLLALAILDDLSAILIIAVFYSDGVAPLPVGLAALDLAALALLNRSGVTRLAAYIPLGVALWALAFAAGIQPTLAGVALAWAIPIETAGVATVRAKSPLRRLERALQPWVAFLVVPLFGFANAGVALGGLTIDAMVQPVPLGVAAGLFLGKQAGVLAFSWAAIRLGVAEFPAGATSREFYGVALLCGIGFTMSLFIGALAFPASGFQDAAKIGVVTGSALSAISGSAVLLLSPAIRRP
jgi:NhaA family Na+:H+ antiporter